MKNIITFFTILFIVGWAGITGLNGQTVLYGVTQNGGIYEQGVLYEYNPATDTYTKKYDFDGTNGGWPSSSLYLYEGKFLGLASSGGGGNGVIYEWDPIAQACTDRYNFDYTNGAYPYGDLTLNNGKFYGTTSGGGANDNGIIFEWDPVSATLINKYDFVAENGYATLPLGFLTLFSGKLYGMTNYGGPDYMGYIYEWDPVTNIFTKKFDFNNTDGFNPYGGLTLYQDKLYGTTSYGGANGGGVIFEWDPVTNTYTRKIDLDCSSGCNPSMSLTLSGDKFYGVTGSGGTMGGGVIYEWDPVTNVYAELHSFDISGSWTDGIGPNCLLTISGGKFYGTTVQGGTGGDQPFGVIFEWDPGTGICTKEFDFDGINGAYSAQTAMLEYTLPGTDNDGDGYSPSAGDCNDDDPTIYPGATETCNGIDDDCDGEIDEDFVYSSVAGATITSSLGNSFCVGPGTVLTIEGGVLGTGAEWVWYEGWCGNGDPIGTGGSISVTPSAGAHSYHVRGEGICNSSDCISITITANFAPYFYFCQENITIGNDPTLCFAVVDYPNIAVNGSPAPVVSYEFSGATSVSGEGTGRGNTFNVGTTYVTVTATNECGSDVCSFIIEVEDTEGPTITGCPSNIIVEAEEGQWGANVSWTPPAATDNCSSATLVSNYEPEHFFNVGSTAVTYSATDEAGNEATCQFLVTVTPPDLLGTVNLSVISSEITFSDNNPDPGNSLNVKAIIRNNSHIDAGSFSVRFTDLYSNNSYPAILVPGLSAGGSVQVNTLFTAPAAPAFVPIQVSVDINGELAESSELDNVAIRPYLCGNLALPGNVGVLAGAVPGSVPAGSNIQICGSASYETDPPLSDPSVAGADVVINILETEQQFFGYTDEDGNFCINYKTPNTPGMYHFKVDISDNTLAGDASGTFILSEPVYPCPTDLSVRIDLAGLTPAQMSTGIVPSGTVLSGTVTVMNNCAAITEATDLFIAPPAGTVVPFQVTIPALDPGEVYPVALPSLTMNDLGTFYLIATVDYFDIIDENDELNNTDYKVLVVKPPKPDITITDVGVISSLVCAPNNQVKFKVSNIGLASTGEFTAEYSFYLNGMLESSQSQVIPNLDPGASTAIIIPFTVSSSSDLAEFEMIADASDLVDELSEINNEYFFGAMFNPCLPDLVVYDCNYTDVKPVDPMSDGNASITATIVNKGESEVTGPFDVDFVIGGIPIRETISGPLAAQAAMTVTVDSPVPVDDCLPLTIVADPDGEITEHDDSNNSFSASLCYDFELVNNNCNVLGPIFKETQHYCNPALFSIGVQNHGLYEASNLGVKYEISGPGLSGWVNLGTEYIYAGSTCGCPEMVTLSETFSFLQTGTYMVRMTADPDNLYFESDESNNVIILSVNVVESADYEVLSSFIFPSDLTPDINEAVSFSVSYTNDGCAGYSSIELHASVDNQRLDSLDVPGLPAGGSNTVAIPATWSSAVPGVHVFRAIIDHDEIISEVDEMNNEATKAIIVGDAPDYNVLNISSSDDSPAIGQIITLSADVRNEGQSAGNGILRFLVSDAYGSEQVIEEIPVSILPGSTQNFSTLWLTNDPNAHIIARVVNVSPVEFDLSDNEKEAQLNDLIITLEGIDASCFGGNDGQIIVSTSGGIAPFSYEWNDPALFGAMVTVAAGTYEVVVMDFSGLTAIETITIGQPEELVISETHTDASCDNLSDGSVGLSVSGGISPYTFSWNNGETTEDLTGLAAGIYNVIVSDANNCSASISVIINSLAIATSWYQDSDNDGYGNAEASIMACTQPAGYVTTPGDCDDNNALINPTAEEVCDNNTDDNCNGLIDEDCSTSCDLSVNAGDDVTTYYGIYSMQQVIRTVEVTGGTPPFNFNWTIDRPLLCNVENNSGDESFSGGTCTDNTCPASGAPDVNPYCSGSSTIYSTLLDTANICVTVTDANGCIASDCFTVFASDVRCISGNGGNHKVRMCHHTNSENNPWVEICVDTNSIDAHLAHGDYPGSCDWTKEGEAEETPEEYHELHFHLYPNPASRKATLEFISLTESNYQIEIVNMTGLTVYREEGKSTTGENIRMLHFPGYSRGIYLVKLNVEGYQVVKKLVIE